MLAFFLIVNLIYNTCIIPHIQVVNHFVKIWYVIFRKNQNVRKRNAMTVWHGFLGIGNYMCL